MFSSYNPNAPNPTSGFAQTAAPLFGSTPGFGGAGGTGQIPGSAYGAFANPSAGGFSGGMGGFGASKPGPMGGGSSGLFSGGNKFGFSGTPASTAFPSTGGFGGGGSGAFPGATPGGFSSNPGANTMFGRQNTGGTVSFGNPAPTGGFSNAVAGFGTTPAAFGAPNTPGFGNPGATSGFTGAGGPGGFSAPNSVSFASHNPTGFGGTGTSAFGGNPGTFGGAALSTQGYGNQGGFGTTGMTPGGFGAGSTGFGNSATGPSGFGAPSISGFGATGLSSASNPMMAGGNAPPGAGTQQVKYIQTSFNDNGQMGQIMHLTAMQAYTNKAVEELRLEDYQYNNVRQKLANTGMAPPTGMFGNNTPGALSGTPNPAGSMMFNTASGTQPGMFGGTSSGLFSNSAAQASTMFGTSGNAGTGLFDASKPGFGTGAGFASPSFGAQNPGGSLFGGATQNSNKPGLFGTQTTSGGLFGASGPTVSTGTSSSLFGGANPSSGLFGGSQPTAGMGGLSTFGQQQGMGGMTSGTPGSGLFAQSGTQNSSLFGGGTGTGSSLFGSSTIRPQGSPGLFAPGASSGTFSTGGQPLMQQSANPLPENSSVMSAYRDPFGLGWLFPQGMPEDVLTLQRRNSDKALNLEPTSALERALKHGKTSVRKSGTADSWKQESLRKSLTPRRISMLETGRPVRNDPSVFTSRKSFNSVNLDPYHESETFQVPSQRSLPSTNDFGSLELRVSGLDGEPVKLLVKVSRQSTVKDLKEKICSVLTTIKRDQIQLIHRGVRLRDGDFLRNLSLATGDEVYFLVESDERGIRKALAPKELLPKLTMSGYTTKPSIIELARMTTEELTEVQDFTIENSFGRIEFLGLTDVKELDLDSIVRIEDKAVVMYPDEKGIEKPQVGKGLNKPARIHMYNCRPKKEVPPELFEEKIRKACARDHTEFESYNNSTGEWVFKASHF